MSRFSSVYQACPFCGTVSHSDSYDVGWEFVCPGLCGHILVWHEEEGDLVLDVVQEEE